MRQEQGLDAALVLVLLCAVFLAFFPVFYCSFTNYDDPAYVSHNMVVERGLTFSGLRWAFTAMHAENWHPLAWISHMLDVSAFGMKPAGHHAMALLIHAAATALLFCALKSMTGRRWASAFVAALFALHPLHVESVAWIAERKDLLCAFFWFSALWAYSAYARRPLARRYALAALFFVLGLLSKPMIITLPLLLLILDFWPLGRWRHGPRSAGQSACPRFSLVDLAAEKTPLLVLSGFSAWITIAAHRGALAANRIYPLQERLANAVCSYAGYLVKTAWPAGLAVYYPHPGMPCAWKLVASVLFLAFICGLCAWQWKRRPYLLAGWLWYILTLTPVIGVIQVGSQAMADRYTYVPLVGIFIMLAWSVPGCWTDGAEKRRALAGAAVFLLAALAVKSNIQARVWKNSKTLFSHAAKVTRNNELAHDGLGVALMENKNLPAAQWNFLQAIKAPDAGYYSFQHLGVAYKLMGDYPRAVLRLSQALEKNSHSWATHLNLGQCLLRLANPQNALFHLEQAARLAPGLEECEKLMQSARLAIAAKQPEWGFVTPKGDAYHPTGQASDPAARRLMDSLNSLGLELMAQGDEDKALEAFSAIRMLDPGEAAAYYNSACAFARTGRPGKAVYWLQEALMRSPIPPDQVRRDPDLAALRGLAGFDAWLDAAP